MNSHFLSPSPQRRRFLQQLGAAGGLLAAPALLRAQPGGLARVRIAVGGQRVLYHLPLTIAEQLGYFRAEGLDVVVQDYAGGALALRALQEGAADVCCGAYEHTLRQQARGQFYRALVVHGRAPQLALAASARGWPQSKGGASFKGMRVGVSAPGSSTHLVANLWLAQAGAGPDDVSFVGVGSEASALAALRQGRVHALCHADPLITVLEQRSEVRLLGDTRTLRAAQSTFGSNMPGGCLYAPQAFVQRQSAQAQALVNAMVHALKWLQTASAADLVRVVPPPYLLGDRGSYLAAFDKVRETISPDGLMPDDGPATALHALSRLPSELALGRVDLARTYTNEFARKAKQRFYA